MRYDSAGVVKQVMHFASQFPLSAAAYHRSQTLSYEALHSQSLQLSRELQGRGVGKGSVVAICIRPGFEILVGLLSIFRCGAIYLALDPDHPHGHLKMIGDDARPHLLLTHTSVPDLGELLACQSLNIDTLPYDHLIPLSAEFDGTCEAAAPAYLMYTSGTTGVPKGVLVSNANLHFYLNSAQTAFRFEPTDIFCNVARYTFSISLFDLLLPLCVGAAVRLVDRGDVLNFSRLIPYLANSTVFHAGPSLLSTLSRYLQDQPPLHSNMAPNFQSLRHVSSGGDIVLPVVMGAMQTLFPHAELYVIYGSTEISCMGTYYRVDQPFQASTALVGFPFPGVEMRLFDEKGHEVHEDKVGEIFFAGGGLGIGYLNQPDLTAEKFIFVGDSRFYSTGDYGRRAFDGSLEMLGRRDFQAKVRGVRIELGAIENRIISLGCASQCAVLLRPRESHLNPVGLDERDTHLLVAFLLGPKGSTAEIRRKLADTIPQEMMPGLYVELQSMPLTFNGKLDRKQLMTRPLREAKAEAKLEEKTSLEASIAASFCRLLGIAELGPNENFFDLGGHSLLGILLIAELERKMGIRLSQQAFFQAPTPRAIAQHWLSVGSIGQDSDSASSAKEIEGCSVVPLSLKANKDSIFLLSGVHIYRNLARFLENDWSVYGIISERELTDQKPGGLSKSISIEELAKDYVQSILGHQAKGPYHILGYSFAGILAFEVAKQLTEADHEVGRLILVDSTLPEWVLKGRYQLKQFLRLLRTSPVLLGPYLWIKVKKQLSKLKGAFPSFASPGIEPPRKASPLEIELSAIEKQRGHRNRLYAEEYMKRIKRYPGDVTLFVATKRLARKPLRSACCGWMPYTGNLKTIKLNADHTDVLEDKESLLKIAREINFQTVPSPLAGDRIA